MMRTLLGLVAAVASMFMAASAHAMASDCLAMARVPSSVQHAKFTATALEADQVRLTFLGHATFLIESPGGVKIATDYDGYAGDFVPEVVTMNQAHTSHYTDAPDPAIKHVLRGWTEDGSPAKYDLTIGDVRIRNVTTDIRSGEAGRIADGNSIFVFEIAGLCIGHLGHLHHELSAEHVGQIGRLDVVLVPVDGGYTMAQTSMMNVLRELKARLVIPMHFFGPTTLGRFISGAASDFEVEMSPTEVTLVSATTLPSRPKLLVLPGY
jgi:L-ascorbate metabolism protein UlaG (beta-lactamase superfamily)